MAMTAAVVEFSSSDMSSLLARMNSLAHRGEGWINIGPALAHEDFDRLPQPSGLSKWFSGRGPAVPMTTWTPSAGRVPAQVGIAHGTGPNALDRLSDQGITLPDGWVKRQDHAKNGIVAELPGAATYESVVAWSMRAMAALSTRVEVGEEWIAEVYGDDD